MKFIKVHCVRSKSTYSSRNVESFSTADLTDYGQIIDMNSYFMTVLVIFLSHLIRQTRNNESEENLDR